VVARPIGAPAPQLTENAHPDACAGSAGQICHDLHYLRLAVAQGAVPLLRFRLQAELLTLVWLSPGREWNLTELDCVRGMGRVPRNGGRLGVSRSVSSWVGNECGAGVFDHDDRPCAETVRRWALQAEIDAGERQGPTSEELAEIKELKAKVRRLEEDLEIATKASIFSRGHSTPAAADHGVHRHHAQRRSRG
jgi:hypothetical protein